MATTAIEFTKVDGDYVCALAGTKGVVHLALSEPNQIVSVEGGVSGLPSMVMGLVSTPYGNGVVFEIDFPEGIEVLLRTSKPVTNGVWIN